MRFIHETLKASVAAAGGADVVDVVMPAQGRPYRELTVWVEPVTSRGVGDAPGVRNFDHETFFGPTSQAASATRTDDEIFFAYDPGDTVRIWPANAPAPVSAHRASPDGITRLRPSGFAITVQLTNLAAAPVEILVHFVAMTIDQG